MKTALKNTKPSVNKDDLKKLETFAEDFGVTGVQLGVKYSNFIVLGHRDLTVDPKVGQIGPKWDTSGI